MPQGGRGDPSDISAAQARVRERTSTRRAGHGEPNATGSGTSLPAQLVGCAPDKAQVTWGARRGQSADTLPTRLSSRRALTSCISTHPTDEMMPT